MVPEAPPARGLLRLKGCGAFLCWASRRPSAVAVDGQAAGFEYDAATVGGRGSLGGAGSRGPSFWHSSCLWAQPAARSGASPAGRSCGGAVGVHTGQRDLRQPRCSSAGRAELRAASGRRPGSGEALRGQLLRREVETATEGGRDAQAVRVSILYLFIFMWG